MELKGKKVNFLGDSITEGVGASCFDNIYHQVMKREYGLAEARAYGISGTRIARQTKPSDWEKFDHDFCERYETMDDDADIVVVFGGTNDFGHGDAPIGNINDRTPYTFYGALRYLFEGLINKYPAATIVMMTPMHRYNDESTRGDGEKPYNCGTLRDYVNVIREVADYYSIPVMDLYANSGIYPMLDAHRERYTIDGLHPNDLGNEVIAHRLGNFLLAY